MNNLPELQEYLADRPGLVVFAELYGPGVQDMHYGLKDRQGLYVFDLMYDGEYLSLIHPQWTQLKAFCGLVDPFLDGRIQYLHTRRTIVWDDKCHEQVQEWVDTSKTTLCFMGENVEGFVVRPLTESRMGRGNQNRAMVKFISKAYLTRRQTNQGSESLVPPEVAELLQTHASLQPDGNVETPGSAGVVGPSPDQVVLTP